MAGFYNLYVEDSLLPMYKEKRKVPWLLWNKWVKSRTQTFQWLQSWKKAALPLLVWFGIKSVHLSPTCNVDLSESCPISKIMYEAGKNMLTGKTFDFYLTMPCPVSGLTLTILWHWVCEECFHRPAFIYDYTQNHPICAYFTLTCALGRWGMFP